MEEIQVRKASNTRLPILSLVDREYLKSVSNINRRSHEAISYLYAEHDAAIERAKAAPTGPEWVRQAVIAKRLNGIRWLDEILLNSQGVDALRSWQMTTGLQAQNGVQQRPTAAVMPDFPQPRPPGTEPKRKSILRGGRAD